MNGSQLVKVGRRRYEVVFRDGWCVNCGGQHVGGWGRCECECHPAMFTQLCVHNPQRAP